MINPIHMQVGIITVAAVSISFLMMWHMDQRNKVAEQIYTWYDFKEDKK